MKRLYLIVVLAIFVLVPTVSLAHPGRTDSSGCHTCRTNCAKWGLSTGEYHCHQAKTLPQPKEPVKSHFNATGGYTTPAPEYKQPAVPTTKATVETRQKVDILSKVDKIDNKVTVETKNDTGWIIKLLKFLFN